MNKSVFTLLLMAIMSFTLPSCKLFKHKQSKKDKKIAARAKAIADSMSIAIKNDIIKSDSLKNIVSSSDTLVDSSALLIQSISPIWQSRIMFNTFSAKAKMHYEGADKSLDFVANIRMKQDSIIWVSVTVAGIVQVARAIITPDSFKAVLYTEKEAYQGPISKANQILPEGLNFYSLQNLLIGNPILNNTTPSSVSSDLTSWVVRLIEHNYVEQLQYDKTDSTMRNTQLLTQGQRSNSLTQNLNNFSLINLIKFSTDRRINIVTDSSAMLVEINYNNINFDTELSYPFSIPKNYTLK